MRIVVGSFLIVATWEASKNWVEVIMAYVCNVLGGPAEAMHIIVN
jgi:hypothetical protein